MHEDKKTRVLAAEDDKVTLMILVNLLDHYGFTCDTAVNGLEAWDKIQKNDYDLIISDWNMPLMDGNQLLKKSGDMQRPKEYLF